MDSSEKGDLKEFLSGFLAKVKAGEKPDAGRLRQEIKKEIGSDETIYKFLGLLESFTDILPEERQRYNAAVRALSATSGLGLQDILASSQKELDTLAQIEKEALSVLFGSGDELAAMESRAEEIRSEIAKLREKIAEFEKEEKEIKGSVSARQKEKKLVEGAIGRIFKEMGSEITDIRDKIEELTSGKAPARPEPAGDSRKSREGKQEESAEQNQEVAEEEGMEEKFRAEETPAPRETEFLKKCPMCGGQIHFLIKESKWMCYTCGHEESEEGDPPVTDSPSAAESATAASGSVIADAEEPEEKVTPVASAQESPSRTAKQSSPGKKKTCPACRKQMEWHESIKSWKCPSCGYRRMVF